MFSKQRFLNPYQRPSYSIIFILLKLLLKDKFAELSPGLSNAMQHVQPKCDCVTPPRIGLTLISVYRTNISCGVTAAPNVVSRPDCKDAYLIEKTTY